MSADRERFLARVRQALGRDPRAPVPGPPPAPARSPALPAAELAQRFALSLEATLGKAHPVAGPGEARDVLRALLAGAGGYARTAHPVLDELGLDDLAGELDVPALPPSEAEWAVSGCEYAVAATGTVVLSAEFGRAVTLLPPKHLVVVRAGQVLPDLNDLYLELAARPLPGAWGMHSGPSRSADIEQTMALGVHGPGVVHALILP
ncbi:MAG TPA: LUD domain-containing protein [Deinococcales bacterium]|nr:LUD domain-containing protein [Deinococcales bacterium]